MVTEREKEVGRDSIFRRWQQLSVDKLRGLYNLRRRENKMEEIIILCWQNNLLLLATRSLHHITPKNVENYCPLQKARCFELLGGSPAEFHPIGVFTKGLQLLFDG